MLALVYGSVLQHIYGFVKFGKNIEFLFVKHHSAALNTAEIKEFFNYACKSGTFFYNNAHTFVKGAPVEFAFFVELHGFCPAFYCRERGS